MTAVPDLEPAARQVMDLLPGVTDDQLSAPTPCAEYTVGDLLDHFMGLSVEFRKAATKAAGKPEGDIGVAAHESRPGTGCAANLDPDWRRQLPLQLNELVAAWRDSAAWEGTTEAGGVTLPADMMGRVTLNELVLHGWDLARSTGQPFEADPSSAEVSFEFTSAMSASEEVENRKGLFGPVVAVPSDAPLFHQVLGLSGRDPSWMPS
ncbi:MAG: TIGR03086 family metal-binding protein [Pseudonocardiaceae bacterium]